MKSPNSPKDGYEKDSQEREQLISKMDEANNLLKRQLTFVIRGEKKLGEEAALEEIERLQDLGDEYTKRIELEKRRIVSLEKQIDDAKTELYTRKQQTGGVYAEDECRKVVSKQIQTLEDKIEKALVQYNQVVADKKAIKAKIDSERKERVIFDKIYRKMENELLEAKDRMSEMVDECNNQYARREKIKQEIDELRKQAATEQQDFQVKFKKISDAISSERAAKNLDDLEVAPLSSSKSGQGQAKMRKDIVKGAWAIGRGKAQIYISAEKVQQYEEAFKKLEEATGSRDVDEIVNNFLQSEESNYQLFNYVNELTSEIDTLEHSIQVTKLQIEKHRGQGKSSDSQRKRKLQELEQRYEKTNAKVQSCESEYKETIQVLNHLIGGITEVFEGLDCSDDQVMEILGDQVNESNVLQYLGIIEQKANEILHSYSQVQEQGTQAVQTHFEVSTPQQQIECFEPDTNSSTRTSVTPPSIHDNTDENNDNESPEPLSIQAIQRKVKAEIEEKSYT